MAHQTDIGPEVDEIRSHSRKLESAEDLDPLIERLEDRSYILLGEASHGTSEFYRIRSAITKKLVEEQEISFIAVEGDWPDCYQINQYVKNRLEETGFDVLSGIDRWPTWMWANWEVLEFIEWLREYNNGRPEDEKVGFYGLDLYSLNESIELVIDYLEEHAPEEAERARKAYQCFEPHTEGIKYSEKLRMVPGNCREEVVQVLTEIRRQQFQYRKAGEEKFFDAEQNALVAKNAENYYRALVEAGTNSWNVRDRHMAETLDRLMDREGAAARSVIWAHNSHVGDSTATDMENRGMLNLGRLIRLRHSDSATVGFSTYEGEVIAADYWGAETRVKNLPPAVEGSYDWLMHYASSEDKIVFLEDTEGLKEERGHRAVGVTYRPEHETGNYVPTRLADRYDFLVFVDETAALHPIETGAKPEEPETYPWGV